MHCSRAAVVAALQDGGVQAFIAALKGCASAAGQQQLTHSARRDPALVRRLETLVRAGVLALQM